MLPAPRYAELQRMCEWWDREVGEPPENLASVLGSFIKEMSLKSVWTALELAARNESLEASEDVLEDVRKRLRRWKRTPPPPAPRMPRNIYMGLGEDR